MAMKLVVVGARGRMGAALCAVAAEGPGTALHAGVSRGDDLAAALDGADGVLDFTTPETSVVVAALAAERGLVHIIGTTGFSAEQDAAIAEAARRSPIVKSGNMSLGVNLVAVLVEQAARALGPDAFDIEILEMHHRHKVDAPSGTALLLGEAAAAGRGVDLDGQSVRTRDGHTGPRPTGAIGFATMRGGSVIGDHRVVLAGEGERIEIAHLAQDRSIYARGAVKAALWARDRAPGLYSMRDVLGL